ncbi:hypothetical protein, partial [Sphingomonas sp. SRS2]|uniref:hypothetical protein n=1 Tax=Sphingomonas sp. SRS2 TaxID=133190 RepID=UPI00061EF332
ILIIALSLFYYHDLFPGVEILAIQKVFLAIFAITMLSKIDPNNSLYKILSLMSGFSLAIYFTHGYLTNSFRDLFDEKDIEMLVVAPSYLKVLLLLIKTAIVLGLAVALIELGRKILTKHSRTLIGA